jgi:AcrR family transcriptional regulator
VSTSRRPTPVRASAIADRAEATRAALLAAARQLFVEKGYFATGTEEIVALAGVGTRGAMYHHFADKRALFVAVIESVEQDLLAEAGNAPESGGAVNQLQRGLFAFLDASLTPEVSRILLIDGPAVLGWKDWRALEADYGLGALRSLLELARAEGDLPPGQPVDALAHILLAAIDEAALFVVNAEEPEKAKPQAVSAVDRILQGIFPQLDAGK